MYGDIFLYRRLTGSMTLYEKAVEETKKRKWGLTARKCPIGSTNQQWGKKENPY
ncbi:hypothetical protein ACFFHH_22170 [Cytobacillus solani]|uniref:hypothetical protein n=1 Tax=Cytobacillus solani TaxID=1637975 RepID=UPI000B033AD6|nr:hypothetical protein [Cytobacillus solani]